MTPLLYHGRYLELEQQFIGDLRRQRPADPLARLDVVISGQLLRLHLKRELARSGCNHANIHFCTLGELAAESALPSIRRNSQRPLRDLMQDPLLCRAIERGGPLGYFSALSGRVGFRRALWNTIRELRQAGVTPQDLAAVAARLNGSLYETLRRKLGDILAVWTELEKLCAEHAIADAVTEYAIAAAAVGRAGDALVFYGLDRLDAMERKFVAALVERRAVTAYLPHWSGPSGRWTQPLFDFYAGLGMEPRALASVTKDETLLGRVQSRLFAAQVSTAGLPDDADHSLLVVSAPSREREGEEIVRELLFSPLAKEQPARTAGILLGDSGSYSDLLRVELGKAGVQGYFHRCRTLGDTPAGRGFQRLAMLLDLRFRRADVMEFLLSCPVRWPESVDGSPGTLPVTTWNHLTIEAGIVEGMNAWPDGFRRLRSRLEMEKQRQDDEDEDRISAIDERLAALESFSTYYLYLLKSLRSVAATRNWSERIAAFWMLYTELIEEDEIARDLRTELDQAASFDALGHPLTPENFNTLVRGVLSRPVAREGRFQVHEPTVATLSETAGVSFDEVILPGVVEKELPRPPRQDPLLLDDDRDLLNKLLAEKHMQRIPLHREERDRELFLFHAALHSARRRAVIFYPRREARASRERLPSMFLLRVAEAALGRRMDYAGLESFIAVDSHGRRVPVSRMRGVNAAMAATTLQYDEARLGEAWRAHSAAPLAYLFHDQPLFRHGIAAEQHRFGEKLFSAWDGVIMDAALAARYREWMKEKQEAISITRFERYASCPFRYFTEFVLDVHSVDEPDPVQRVQHRERGALVHQILERFYRAEHEAGRLPVQEDALPRLEEIARRTFKRFEEDGSPGLRILWSIDQERLLREMREFVRGEISDDSGFIPRYFNRHFEMTASNELPVSIRGTLDRVDIAPDGRARAIDYTTGREKSGARDGSFGGGTALRLPLYRLAVEREFELTGASASFRYLSEQAKRAKEEYTSEHWSQGSATFTQIIETLKAEMEKGYFFPYPATAKCSYCPARAACGTGRLTFKWQTARDQAAGFLSIVEDSE